MNPRRYRATRCTARHGQGVGPPGSSARIPNSRGGDGFDAVPRLPGEKRIEVLENGLTLCVLDNPQAAVVTTSLWYRAGARHEAPGQGGQAHFLEHMMFKGSAAYGPGEIDRITQLLGGSNNAFTTHDTTAYYFKLASDRWAEALRMEADRMAHLTLDPAEVASERQVILEEISMYENDPWDALETEVHRVLFQDHPYARSVLGTRQELLALDENTLRSFHRSYYRPKNAVLVVAGEVGEGVREAVEETFGDLPGGEEVPTSSFAQTRLECLQRLERRQGDVSRFLLALPAPSSSDPDHAVLRLLLGILAGGKAGRLHRSLVEEEQLCVWVSAQVSDTLDPGYVTFALEPVPGVEPERAEAELLKRIDALGEDPPTAEEIGRAKQIALADWVFGHERIHEQALSLGYVLTLFDLEYLERYLRRTLDATPDDLARVAVQFLRPDEGGVLGWSHPAS